MRFTSVADWLAWQEHLHPFTIELGLDRVKHVLETMQLVQPPYHVVTVGGTNGKGSCVAFLDAILRAQGYKVGAYTSPHLLRYNERICINGAEATDAELCAAFERVDAARGEVSLTYFEFGTLAALDIFRDHKIDVALLEVGMGGRLDAVNGVDTDGALVASIGLDHQEWLGNDRDSIGYEKAGIYRRSKPAICGDRDPPPRLLETARQLEAELQILGVDFDWQESASGWQWRGRHARIPGLPRPALSGQMQMDNAASCIALLQTLTGILPVDEGAIRTGIKTAYLPARFEQRSGDVSWVMDIAHNPAAARVLAANLARYPVKGKTLAVVGILRDKSAEDIARALTGEIDAWFVGGLGGARGQSASDLARRIRTAAPRAILAQYQSVEDACRAVQSVAVVGDRIVVFGSFHTVSAILRLGQESGTNNI